MDELKFISTYLRDKPFEIESEQFFFKEKNFILDPQLKDIPI